MHLWTKDDVCMYYPSKVIKVLEKSLRRRRRRRIAIPMSRFQRLSSQARQLEINLDIAKLAKNFSLKKCNFDPL